MINQVVREANAQRAAGAGAALRQPPPVANGRAAGPAAAQVTVAASHGIGTSCN